MNVDERMNLQLSLPKLFEHENFEEVLLWGKIKGTAKDYYIALALNYKGHYEFPHKRFFWCTSQNWTFSELSAINPNDKEHAEKFNSLFTGEPEKILVAAAEPEAQEAVSDHGEEVEKDSLASTEEEKIPAKNFTELDRLAYVVRAIEQDNSVVPEGAFRMTPSHELVRNAAFEGLSREALRDISKYAHFRNVQLPEKREQLDRDDALFTYNFLDPIERDLPKGAWSLQIDHSGSLATVRSFLWPGYFAFHKANSNSFGGIYIGDGVKNTDLPFMI